jgi:RIO-like serine/threonine protein kinase
MGFVLEKLNDMRSGYVGDLRECEQVLGMFHGLGFLHGDVNKYSFLVANDGVKVIDFERFEEESEEGAKTSEM